eukprot:TRINITY_DN911_c0_g1_i1.p2 TRINITY_DN911_c0_g1~~TRINITY_DN911_c0_g1_i1.p2  ORF type:complete len:126 (+),score=44.63 TRINITY_DN911_c0_g1_i1:56-433(+)
MTKRHRTEKLLKDYTSPDPFRSMITATEDIREQLSMATAQGGQRDEIAKKLEARNKGERKGYSSSLLFSNELGEEMEDPDPKENLSLSTLDPLWASEEKFAQQTYQAALAKRKKKRQRRREKTNR